MGVLLASFAFADPVRVWLCCETLCNRASDFLHAECTMFVLTFPLFLANTDSNGKVEISRHACRSDGTEDNRERFAKEILVTEVRGGCEQREEQSRRDQVCIGCSGIVRLLQ